MRTCPCAAERARVDVERVGLDQRQAAAGVRLELAQQGDEAWDRAPRRRRRAAARIEQGPRQPAGSGADLEHGGLRRGRRRPQRSGPGSTGRTGSAGRAACWPEPEAAQLGAQLGPGPRSSAGAVGRSEPDVDKGVAAQAAQVAAGLPLDLLLLDGLADLLADRGPPAAAGSLVAHLEDVHAAGLTIGSEISPTLSAWIWARSSGVIAAARTQPRSPPLLGTGRGRDLAGQRARNRRRRAASRRGPAASSSTLASCARS